MVLLGLRATAGDPNAAVHFTADGLVAAIARDTAHRSGCYMIEFIIGDLEK